MNTVTNPDILLQVNDLKMYFPLTNDFFGKPKAYVKAVDGISFSVERGTTFGLVGESGCGKTTTGKCILGINQCTAGEIIYKGRAISSTKNKNKRKLRSIQLVFQDPYGSLDPRQTARSIILEAIVADGKKHDGESNKARVKELLSLVELGEEIETRFPHEMSGGQRQRLCIARALACNPDLIVCDEAVSALDVSIQAQIINLFERLQRQLGLTYIFISHDLAVVKHIADKIAVMYLGRIVEIMSAEKLYSNPLHPYTKALLSAVPTTDYYAERKRERIVLKGEVPSLINVPSGCPFHPRCPYATDLCKTKVPGLRQVLPDGHQVACHYPLINE